MAVALQATTRPDLKNSTKRKFREDGQVPGILYGKKIESQPIAVDQINFVKLIRDEGRNSIISLDVNGKKHEVMVYDMQVDPLKNELVHIDFCAVDMSSEVDTEVKVHLVGEAPGVGEGGMVSHLVHQLSIRALPSEIPSEITVDISNLNIGDSIQVKDIIGQQSVEITNDPEETIVTVLVQPAEQESGQVEEEGEPEAVQGDEAQTEGNEEQ
ncbi:50S ribosomal protein L25/general stress protein Ctc [Alkalihalobacterium chitinilyticum]|uniref:Large ribosomal subunit protein bL25 n=1 Tax=Alkalihalobacterium chitinilyticum TaxID=2980103 RepID=A0ABT5VKL8_9BACI|nr:50S ribosomal protein L25/general stress protein Ctc [Alkalihalobacterium chitinilyticum]MDE5415991.1 50S ribosomal protein L25/general stress protein Ctc [Alkalihalobacterium chitinilyticum]